MPLKTILVCGASLTVLAGAGFQFTRPADRAFIPPGELADSACGGGQTAASYLGSARFIAAARAYAQETGAAMSPFVQEDLGHTSFAISTPSAETQARFDRGVGYVNSFNHVAGIAEFKAAQAADPDCAMCYWGEAFALGTNINAPMDPETAPAAYAAAQKAKALGGETPRERALIEAIAVRYSKDPKADQLALDKAFADAMIAAADSLPDDDVLAAIAAESVMDAQPWDYWEANGRTPKGRAADAIRLVEKVLERNPGHAPSIHLYIHLTEASDNPYRAERYADTLAALMPGAGHIVHMPAHTYYRIGRYADSINANIAAAAADERYLASAGEAASPLYKFGYYPHNLHFLLTSAQMAGDPEAALSAAQKLDAALPIEMLTAAPWVEPIKAAPYYAYATFMEPADILALPEPDEKHRFLVAASTYARGIAYARAGGVANARKMADALDALAEDPHFAELAKANVPAPDIVKLAAEIVRGRAAQTAGDLERAIAHFETAVALQDALPYTEPPFWYYPARQSLGAALLAHGEAGRAQAVFYRALVDSPNNGWALFGLAQAHAAQGDKKASRYAMDLFRQAWRGDKKGPSLSAL